MTCLFFSPSLTAWRAQETNRRQLEAAQAKQQAEDARRQQGYAARRGEDEAYKARLAKAESDDLARRIAAKAQERALNQAAQGPPQAARLPQWRGDDAQRELQQAKDACGTGRQLQAAGASCDLSKIRRLQQKVRDAKKPAPAGRKARQQRVPGVAPSRFGYVSGRQTRPASRRQAAPRRSRFAYN